MSLDLGTLVGRLSMDGTGWMSGFGNASGVAQKFGTNVPMWMGVASAAIIAGGIAAAAGLFKIGEAYDTVRDDFRTNNGAIGDELDGLVSSAEDVAARVPASFEAIGVAVSDVEQRLGLSGDTLETVSAQFLEAGRILGEDIDIQAATGALNAFHIEGEDTSAALDHLFQQSQRTGIGMNDLVAKVAAAAPITQQLGFTFEETAGMIASFDKAGMDSSGAIAAMQRGLAGMTEPGEEAGDTFRRVVGDIEGFIAAGDDASARALASEIFGSRGAAQFIGALQSGAMNMEDLAAMADLTGDSILGVGEETMDAAEKWQILQNNATAALAPLGDAVFEAVGQALDAMMPGLTAVAEWLGANPAAIQIIAAVLGILALAFVGVTIATWAMNTALLANPITWIILAVVALIAAIVLLVMNWDAVVAWISEVWAGFVGWITDVINGFAGWWGEVWAGITGFFTDLWDGAVAWVQGVLLGWIQWQLDTIAGFMGWWEDTWAAVGRFFTDLWDGIVSFVTDLWRGHVAWVRSSVIGFVQFWTDVWNGVSRFFSDLWSGIVGFVVTSWNNVLAFLGGIPDAILDVFSGSARWLYNIGRDILQGLWDGLESIWSGLVNWIEDIGQGIADTFGAILGIHSPSTVFRQFGINIGEGLIEGLEDIQPEVDAMMGDLTNAPSRDAGGNVIDSNNVNRGDTTIIVGSPEEAADVFELLDHGRP